MKLAEPTEAALRHYAKFRWNGITDEHGRRLMDVSSEHFTELRRQLQGLKLVEDTGADMRCGADGVCYRVYRISDRGRFIAEDLG